MMYAFMAKMRLNKTNIWEDWWKRRRNVVPYSTRKNAPFVSLRYPSLGTSTLGMAYAQIQKWCRAPIPPDKEDMQKFIGIMTYVCVHPKRTTDVPFEMSEDHTWCFESLKSTMPQVLRSTNINCSGGGQLYEGSWCNDFTNGFPVAFASKSLDPTQSNYINIDCEMMAVFFGITRFHTYLYGRPFKVVTDHKSLKTIVLKPLPKAPPRLQRMLQKVQEYDFVMADTLSPLPSITNQTVIELDLRVGHKLVFRWNQLLRVWLRASHERNSFSFHNPRSLTLF